MELKWLMLTKHKKWFHSSRVKFPLLSMSASWFVVSMYLIWISGSKLIRSNNQSRTTLWVLETCLVVGLLPFNNHLDHCFVVFKDAQQSFLMRKIHVWGNKIDTCSDQSFHAFSFALENETGLTVLDHSDACFCEELWRSYPTNQVRRYCPTSILLPWKWFLILLNCARLKFVSCTSNLLEQLWEKWILPGRSVRSAVFAMELRLFLKFFTMNIADSIVTAFNIDEIIERFFSFSCNVGNSFLSFSHLIIHPIREWSRFYRQFQFCCIASHDEILSLPPLDNWYYQVALIYHEVALRTLRIARFRREELLRDKDELVVSLQEALSGCRDRSCVVTSFFHSWEDQARSSSNFEKFVEEKLSVSLSSCPDLSCATNILTKGSFTREEWNHLLCLLSISHFSPTVCSAAMAKRIQQESGEERVTNRDLWWFLLPGRRRTYRSRPTSVSLASLFLVSMYLIWILETRLVRSKNQSRATLWVLETFFNDHFDHCFIVFKYIQWSFLTRGLDVWGNGINVVLDTTRWRMFMLDKVQKSNSQRQTN